MYNNKPSPLTLRQEVDYNYARYRFLLHRTVVYPEALSSFPPWDTCHLSFTTSKNLFHGNRLRAPRKGLEALIGGLLCRNRCVLK